MKPLAPRIRTRRGIVRSLGLFLALASPQRAQEISFQAGASRAERGDSYSWEVEFRHELARNVSWSAAWINEGHSQSYHRDGLGAQIWVGRATEPGRFSTSLGVGGYYYYNTILLPGDVTVNSHGTTPIYSLSETYSFQGPVFIRATYNHIATADGHAGDALILGAGYFLGATRSDPLGRTTPSPPKATGGELTVLLGRSAENDAISENAAAAALEYRRGIGKNYDWTVTWLNEGDPHIVRRSGIATQIWAAGAFPHERITLGVGVGPYLYSHQTTHLASASDRPGLAALVSPTVSYRISESWHARFTWERVISRDDRDADVFLLGAGYRWANLW